MKILLCSLRGDGLWFGWLLKHNGHEVDWTVKETEHSESLSGIFPPPKSKVNAKNYDLVVFDCTEMGEVADAAVAAGVPVIGDSLFSDELEDNRIFGIQAMEAAGIKVPAWEAFDNPADAIAWLKKTHKRCVLKPLDDAPSNMTYVGKSDADMIAFIETSLPGSKVKKFLLQEYVSGTEVSTEAWWTGTEWCAINYTLEEKKFMAGGLGPNTGCAGNVVWMPAKPTPLFQQGLEKISPLLVDANYRGMVDLNTIVTEGGVYGLEWTPRFGYEGTCNLTRLLPVEFGEFMHSVATGVTPPNLEAKSRFAATLRISVPPYPNKPHTKKGEAHQPIKGLQVKDLDTFYIFDVRQGADGSLVVVGEGNIGTPIGVGETIAGAMKEVEMAIDRLEVPDLQYRCDVTKCIEQRYATLQSQGWLKSIG